MRFWAETEPPRAAIRSRLSAETVSAWSKGQRLPPGKSPSAASFSKTARSRRIVSSYVAWSPEAPAVLHQEPDRLLELGLVWNPPAASTAEVSPKRSSSRRK
ncbi:hypothetical protein STANM309S_04522 [Streptomyces tanashiensis]